MLLRTVSSTKMIISTWSADFSSQMLTSVRFLVWAHFLGLPIYVRNEKCLQFSGKHSEEFYQ